MLAPADCFPPALDFAPGPCLMLSGIDASSSMHSSMESPLRRPQWTRGSSRSVQLWRFLVSRSRTSDAERGGPIRLTTARDLVQDFSTRYANPKTRQHYGAELGVLFAGTGRRHP